MCVRETVCVCKRKRESDRALVADGEGRESASGKPLEEEEWQQVDNLTECLLCGLTQWLIDRRSDQALA